MGDLTDRARSTASAVLVGVLLVAGTVEIVASVIHLGDAGAAALAAHGAPSSLLPFTLAAVAAAFCGRRARILAFFGSAAALIARVVMMSLLVVPGWYLGLGDALGMTAGLLTGIAALGWTLFLVVGNRDLADSDEGAAPPAITQPRWSGPAVDPVTPNSAADRPAESPSTPVARPQHAQTDSRAGSWATASTPWPRAVEDDPNGTLIRPPRR